MGKKQEFPLPRYRITILGHLPLRWAERFEDIEIQNESDGTTTLYANLPDQAALYGLIIKCRDLGLTLLAVNKTSHHTRIKMTK